MNILPDISELNRTQLAIAAQLRSTELLSARLAHNSIESRINMTGAFATERENLDMLVRILLLWHRSKSGNLPKKPNNVQQLDIGSGI